LLGELDFYRKKFGFKIFSYVIMPDHLHCLIFWDIEKYPEITISKIMMAIKGYSAKLIINHLGRLGQLPQPTRKGENKPHHRQWEHQIWQPNFYDFNIYTEYKFQEKLNYIHDNPRRASLCKNPEDYRWSSYKQITGSDPSPIFKVDFFNF
jgi:putative transposase